MSLGIHFYWTASELVQIFWRLSEVHWLKQPPTSLEFLPPCDGFCENGVHYAFASKVHARGRGLSLLNPLLCSRERISWTGQRRDQVHLCYGRRLRYCFGSEGGQGKYQKSEQGVIFFSPNKEHNRVKIVIRANES